MDVFKTLILDTPTVEGATGTVTSVDLTAGTGISVSGGPITSSGSITVTNTAPDQTVSIASGTGISVTGSYPSFTVTNSSPSLGGDVVGPASATDNAVVRFDSTTGKLVQDSGVSISDANLLTTTALTVNDNTILGSSNTDTVTFNARSASEFTPATDNTYDLGRTGHEWRDLYINGTANIDSLVADTADVNGGTIDGATIGASTASSGAFTTLSASDDVNFDSGTLFVDASADSVGIGTSSPSAKLDVNGNAAVTGKITVNSGSNAYGVDLSGSSSNITSVSFVNSNAASIRWNWGIQGGTYGTAGDMSLNLDGVGDAITVSGSTRNVGVGLTSPVNKFEVVGTNAAAAASGSAANGAMRLYGSGSGAVLDSGIDGTNTWLQSRQYNDYSSNYSLLLNPNGGNVGIGTTSPSAKLDVNGNVAVTGDISDSKGEIRLIPQNSKSAAYTLVASDSGKHILHPSADTTARTFTIPANASVAFPIGTAVTFVNQDSAGVVTIAITSDTMRLAGAGTTGSRTLAANGVATAIKITSTEWIISGNGLT